MPQMVPIAQSQCVLPRILAVAADVFQVPESSLGPASSPDTIESWDSLHHLSFVLALEQEFHAEFSPEEIEQLLSIELTAALLAEKLKDGGSSNGSGI
jgi:acyl carrier protein